MNKTQKRIVLVLDRLIQLVKDDDDFAKAVSADIEVFLNDIHGNDGFGTEGQSDPRGDFRSGHWSMTKVEGIDK